MYIPYFPDCKPQLFPKCNAISLYTSAVYIYVTRYIFTYKIFLLLYSMETYSLQLLNQFTLHVLFLWCSFEDFDFRKWETSRTVRAYKLQRGSDQSA